MNATTPQRASRLCFCLLLCAASWAPLRAGAATSIATKAPVAVKLATAGQALVPVVISDKASPRVVAIAHTLADYLGRISGATFAVQTIPVPFAPAQAGLLVGTAAEFGDAALLAGSGATTGTEDYVLRSNAHGAWLAGASDMGVEHAVWDFLYQLGYRQFFPGATWEIVPKNPAPRLAIDKFEHPDFYARRIWPGFGTSKPNYNEWLQWCDRNRATSGIEIVTGHSYNSIITRNQKEFDAHPEYYALVNGKRQSWNGGKFCISNPALRQLVVEDSLRQFADHPGLQSISLDPSDGGDWCQCPQCLAMGSVTDRVVTLANQVAAAVEAKYPGKFFGIYAYNEHSPPPTISVDPHIVVSIATAYIRGGFTLDQLLDGWSKKAKLFGIREYYSFYKWDWDMPGMARVSNLEYLKTSTTHFYQRGARFMNSESSDNWGPNGLGYYIAAHLLWNTKDAANIDSLKKDFLDKCFGPARAPMADWYNLIDGSNKPLLTPDLVGRLYRDLDKALHLTNDPAIRARLYDLALYVHYIDSAIATGARKPSFEQNMRFAWRVYRTHMIHTTAIWSVSAAQLPPEAAFNLPADKNPWKSDVPYNPAEIDAMIAEGITGNPTAGFTPVAFGSDLVPTTSLLLPAVAEGNFGFIRGEANLFTWAPRAPFSFDFSARCGISTGAVAGTAKFALYANSNVTGAVADSAEVARDFANTYPLKLHTDQQGLQKLTINDGAAGTTLTWPQGVPLTFESSMRLQHSFQGKYSLYFYVPRGTKVVGGYQENAAGTVQSADGKTVLTLGQGAPRDYFSVAVPAGQDGKLWKLQDAQGQVRLLTVPPYLARSGAELLLPHEVVTADAGG